MAKTFKEMTEKYKDTVLVVDAMNLAFRWKHSKAEIFAESFYDTVISLANSYKCSKIIIAADHRGSKYRKAIYPEYKANRKEMIDKQTEEEKEAFEMFIREYEETLRYLEMHDLLVLRYEQTEADDIAAYITKIIPNHKIWLISTDRDWDLLLTENVKRWSYINRKEFTIDNWFDHYNVTPENYLSYKCLAGDTGDNIPGVLQVGPKRAAQLIEQYGDIFDICAALPISSHYKYIQNLNEFGKDRLLLNVELMDLIEYCEEALGAEACDDISTKTMEYLI